MIKDYRENLLTNVMNKFGFTDLFNKNTPVVIKQDFIANERSFIKAGTIGYITFDNLILNNLGENFITLSWSMAARHIRAWELETSLTNKENTTMAKKFTFDNSLAQDIKNAVNDSYIDNIKMIDVADIIPNSDNFYSMDNIDELADDIERQGLKNVLVVYPDGNGKYILKSGHRRREAIKLLIDTGRRKSHSIPCYIDGVKSETETKIDLIMLNATARTYTDADVMQQYKELTKAYEAYEKETGTRLKGRMRERIAAAMSISPAQVGKIENITHNAIPDIIESVEKGEVSISTANEIAKLSEKQQEVYAADIENVTHKEVKAAVQAQKKSPSSLSEKKKDYVPSATDISEMETSEFSEFNDNENMNTEAKGFDYNDDSDKPVSYTIYIEEADILRKYMDKIVNLMDNIDECEIISILLRLIVL